MIYKSRHGFHPCSYETMIIIKQLNCWYHQAKKRMAVLRRWRNKAAHNRMAFVHIKGEKFCFGLMPEPVWTVKDYKIYKTLIMLDIEHLYVIARTPMPRKEYAAALIIDENKIRKIAIEANEI